MRYRFGISIALNLFLLTTIVAARVDASRESAVVAASPFRETQFGEVPERGAPPAGIGELEARLLTAGFRSSDIKPMILGWLNSVQSGSAAHGLPAPPAAPFWQADYRPGLSGARWQVGHQSRIRDSLRSHFGNEATVDPAFAAAFRPLGPDYDFLNSDAQIELQAHQLRLLEAAGPPSAAAPVQMHCAAPSAGAARDNSASLPAGFSAAAEREYRLRFSPLAQQLRANGTSHDEREFRLLFDRLVRLEQSASPQQPRHKH
jgi:hypothetical protein